MTIKSALDQPFLAEIDLIDVDDIALKDIKVNVAAPENFEEVGLQRSAILSLLNFIIEKNQQGKEIVKVSSSDRISEPYMNLVIDLTWPEGQLYKSYTILLDPPGYHLTSSTIQGGATHYKYHQEHKNIPGVIDKTVITSVNHKPTILNDGRKKASYGPTVTNESIWQIAQRYKSSHVILPQVVLAIVGANSNAFNEGNLNGLKVGVRLIIPSTSEIALVPSDLATAEVMAHDKAWNDKHPIEHVLTPPYMNNTPTTTTVNAIVNNASSPTTVPPIPVPSSLPLIPANINNSFNTNPPSESKSQDIEQNANTKAELSLTVAAVESVREANALLMEQLRLLQKQNDKLQKQLNYRNKEIKQLKIQIQELMKQSLSSQNEKNSSTLFWLFLLLLIASSGAGAVWYIKNRQFKCISFDVPELKKEAPELKKEHLKSQKALETLLILAKKYISMSEFESARRSLEEVIEHGSAQQKEEAISLLNSINEKQ